MSVKFLFCLGFESKRFYMLIIPQIKLKRT